ncbi:hypothetical protein ET475_17555 [Microbacterium protaetiae]|uniref:Cell division protein FtsL n=1 Tax=Microbacterium protaetiae TaxID=2509458 RepID=A0A4P6EI10_9MICO|nr:hypothetical protein [Microbacterium protaetiae]QAY61596.1 hypothetical protein ET475_17555 [Microbacterium protaetiae]
MSTATATVRPLAAPPAPSAPSSSTERRLRALERPDRRPKPRLLYGLVAVAGALAIVGAQMVLSVMTTQSSYEMARLNAQQRELTLQKQVLGDELTGLNSPQYLASNAAALGMVVDTSPSYLRLSDGKILGAQKAASSKSAISLGKGTVANKLIADTPLVTDPDATIDGSTATTPSTTENVTPVPVTDGLPTVRTH